jgi:hypothetical protein
LAYLVGQLAGEIPVAGGIGVIDGGLIGAMILYGLPGTVATANALAYHAIALAIPMLLGAIAAVPLARRVRGWSRNGRLAQRPKQHGTDTPRPSPQLCRCRRQLAQASRLVHW